MRAGWVVLLATWALSGCGLGHRQLKFVAPPLYSMENLDEPALMKLQVERDGERVDLDEATLETESGRKMTRPMLLRDRDVLVFENLGSEPLQLQLATRGAGRFPTYGFRPVIGVTGSLPRRFANEVLPIPANLVDGYRLSVHDLDNPFNYARFSHGDLLLVRVVDAQGREQAVLFRRRDVGFYLDGFTGLSGTFATWNTEDTGSMISAGLTLGFRARSGRGPSVMLDTTELVLGAGVLPRELPRAESVVGIIDALTLSGGVRMFKVFTFQGFLRPTVAVNRNLKDSTGLAVGIDPVAVASLTRGILARLLSSHPLRRGRPRER